MAPRIRYESVARRLVVYAYSIRSEVSFTAAELLEIAGTDDEREHVLVDLDATRQTRLGQLDAALQKAMSDYEFRRMVCPLEPGTVERTYRARLRVSADLDPTERDRRLRLALVTDYQTALFTLPPRGFELICREVLRAIGCVGITVTRASKDDGVDGMAKLPMGTALVPLTPLYRLAADISFFIYLQAKAHGVATKSDVSEVAEVQGAWDWLRNAYTDRELSEELATAMARADFRAADPVLLILATTSTFTSGAVTKAQQLGMITLDGEQIAQLLIEAGHGVQRVSDDLWAIDLNSLVPEEEEPEAVVGVDVEVEVVEVEVVAQEMAVAPSDEESAG
jgi:hypothetical protein